MENATIVLRDGGVLSVEPSGEVPGAVVHDLTGHVVAPGFIDPSVLVEAEIGDAAGSHWNRLVHPEFDFTSSASFDSESGPWHRQAGFTLVAIDSKGIFEEQGRNIATAEDGSSSTSKASTMGNVNAKVGLDFSSALPLFLRQDPDVIMVGEILDGPRRLPSRPRRPATWMTTLHCWSPALETLTPWQHGRAVVQHRDLGAV